LEKETIPVAADKERFGIPETQREIRMVSKREKEKVFHRVVKKAGDYEEISISCAQGTLAALQEEFGLGGTREVIKAATFMPGIASRKETCGALAGGLMALGLKFGKDKISNPEPDTPEGRAETIKFRLKAWRFCEEFKKEFGSTMCGDIRPRIMGRDYNSLDPKDRQQFLADGGPKKCRVPAEKAARIAAGIMMEEE
jgi:C_GCAxxG_C_C family probable redox protein